MSNCSPSRSQNKLTCFSLEELQMMCIAWNKTSAGTRDKINIEKLQSLSNNNSTALKKLLWSAMQEKFKPYCGENEACWLDSVDLGKQLKALSPGAFNIMNYFTLKPKGTEKKNGWLTTNEIDYVMQQYAILHPNFKYFGCVPSDYYKLSPSKFPSKHLDQFEKAALVFNLDASHQKGSHWVALFFDIDENSGKRIIEYFDPTGYPPNKNIKTFLSNTYFSDSTLKISKKKHQRGNSECGVYSLYFILKRIEGQSLDDINKGRIADSDMNKFRSYLFRPHSEKFTM